MKRNPNVFGTLLKMKTVIIFCSLIMSSVEINEVSVLQAISVSIGDMVLECQTELEFKNDVIRDLLDFWNAKNDLRSRDLGCALVCVYEKNEFLNEEGTQVQADKLDEFYKSAGADETMSRNMVKLFELCSKSTRNITSLCDIALEMAKCFRYGILMIQWAPERDYWNHTDVSPDPNPDEVFNEMTLPASLREEMNKRKMFTKLFRSCRK